MHVADRTRVINSINSLQNELEKRFDVHQLIIDSVKDLENDEQFTVLATIYDRYSDYGRIGRMLKMKASDVMMQSNNSCKIPISVNITKDYLSESLVAGEITPFQMVAQANFHLYENEQLDLFSKHYEVLKPFKKAIHLFVLKDSK